MPTLWFCLVAFMLIAYVVLDGFDLGAGIIHLFVARTDSERTELLASIGPVWNGNEVWLIAAGGTLYFAFPALYASSFSAFYLPLMIVLWLLMLRGMAIEFRDHLTGRLWPAFWDVVFAGASLLLAIFFGAALGNVIRGVPLDESGFGFLPLWTDFRTGPEVGVIDWYTILIGLTAAIALTMHGALWVGWRTHGDLQQRCRRLASTLWWPLLLSAVLITIASFRVQPHLLTQFAQHPWGIIFPVTALAALITAKVKSVEQTIAFQSSAVFLSALLASAAFGLYPYVLPSSLTIYNTAAKPYGLSVGLMWWIPGILLALAYFAYLYWQFWGRSNAASCYSGFDKCNPST